MMVEITILYILISVLMTLTFIEGHSCMEKKLKSIFSQILSVDLDKIQYVATTSWFVEAHAKFIL